MSNGGMIGLMPRTKRGLVLFFSALFMLSIALQYAAATMPKSALAVTGAVFTSNFDGSGIDLNIYDNKGDVYLTGGPCGGGSHLEDGDYYFQVTSPNGELLSSDAIGDRFITVDGGFIISTSAHVTHDVACTTDPGITVQLLPYDDTPNPGGEYKLTVGLASDVEACDAFEDEALNFVKDCKQIETKSDNYKVGPNGDLKIVKEVDGGEVSGDFTFHVDCGNAFDDDVTITFPDPGFVVIKDLPEDAECTVTETDMPNPPTNFEWGDATITGSPATIGDDTTVTVTVTNHLIRQTGSLTISKDVTGGPDGFEGSFDIHVDCGEDGEFDRTIDFPDPGEVTIDDIPAGAECTVSETGVPTAPDGFKWNDPIFTGNPATIKANGSVTVGITNPLEELPPPGTPTLTIEKTNDAELVNGLPTAEAGDTVTFTLAYSFTGDEVTDATIEDVLPEGLTYVNGSASSDGQFAFVGYDATTRTLSWAADTVDESGSVHYDATVDADAAELEQPLTNVATIDSEETAPDSDESDVFVGAPPQAETTVPTPPQTDTVGSPNNSASGGSMLLILAALAAIALAGVFIAPTPARIRKRMNR